MFLSVIDEPLIQEMCEGAAEEDVQIVRSAAALLQRHLVMIWDLFNVLLWTKRSKDYDSTVVSVAISGCSVDAHIFSLNGEPDSMFAARLRDQANAYDEFCGPLFSLNVHNTIGSRPSRLFTAPFWRKKSHTSHMKSFRFRYRGGDEISQHVTVIGFCYVTEGDTWRAQRHKVMKSSANPTCSAFTIALSFHGAVDIS